MSDDEKRPDAITPQEWRIRRDIRAVGLVVLGAVVQVSTYGDTSWRGDALSVIAFVTIVVGVTMLRALPSRCPGSAPRESVWRSIRQHPWVWAFTIALGVSCGVTGGMALVHGTWPWIVSVALLYPLAGAWLPSLVRASRRGAAQ